MQWIKHRVLYMAKLDTAEVWLKPLSGAKSQVWKFFGFATNENCMIKSMQAPSCGKWRSERG